MGEIWRRWIDKAWLAQVPENIKKDPLWRFEVYPKALLLADLVWKDTEMMMQDARGRAVAQQLVRSAGSICANIEEGHGRGFGKDNAYFRPPASCFFPAPYLSATNSA